MATNFEFYKDEIMKIADIGNGFGLVNGKVEGCVNINCAQCAFRVENKSCAVELIKWLYAEHIKQPKLTKRERAFCEVAQTGWIARDADDRVHWYDVEPTKTAWEWQYNSGQLVNLDTFHIFDFIKWKDEKPWLVADLLKLEVMEVQEDG